MAVSVDERVVSMRFDNNQFVNGVTQTLQSIAALKAALNFAGVSQGLQEVGDSLKNWSLDTMQQGLDAVTVKFSFLDTLAMNFFNRLSSQIVDATTNMAKWATGIEGAAMGFDKYAEKTRAVQTILTAVESKGYDLQAVNDVLDDMNWFTDETSYNFTEMANTIGKFTSSGVDLMDAKEAVQGIALWAAESGQNAQTASRAMYQLSQAYGTGIIRLQDWMSIEQANMSTEKIQNQLIEEGGKAAEAAIAKYGGFRDSLRAGWLTTEVFTNVMQKYSEGIEEANWQNGKFVGGVTELSEKAFLAAQQARTWQDTVEALRDAVSTGWMHTWEYVFGNKDEASEFFTTLANNLIEVSDYFTELRNSAIEAWYDFGGRTDLVEGIFQIWDNFGAIFGSIGDAISSVINPAKTIEDQLTSLLGLSDEGDKIINDIRSIQEDMSKGLIPDDIGRLKIQELREELDRLDNSSGLLKITNNIKNFAEEMRKAFNPGEGSEAYSNQIEDLTKKLSDLKKEYSSDKYSGAETYWENTANDWKEILADSEKFNKFYKEQVNQREKLGNNKDKFKEWMNETISEWENHKKLAETIKETEASLAEAVDNKEMAEVAERNLGEIESVARGITSIFKTAVDMVTGFVKAASELASPVFTIARSLFDFFGALGEFVVAITGASEEGNKFYSVFKKIVDAIFPPFESFCETIAGWIDELTVKIDELTGGILEGNSPILTFIDTAKIKIEGFSVLLGQFFESLGQGTVKLDNITSSVTGFFTSFINNSGPLGTVLKSLWEIFTGFADALMKVFTTTEGAEEGGRRILSLAEILSRAGELIGQVSGGLVNGILNIFENIGKSFTKLNLGSIFRIIKGFAITEAIISLAGFFKELQGLAGEIKSVFQIFTGMFDPKSITNVVEIFKSIGLAFVAIAGALFIISLIPTEQLNPVIGALTVILLEIAGMFGIMALISQKTTNGHGNMLDGLGDTFLSMALSLVVIAFAVKMLGNIGIPELIQGLFAVGLIMAALAVCAKWLTGESTSDGGFSIGKLSIGAKKTGQEMMKGSVGFVMMAIAIRIIAGAVKKIGEMEANQIEQGLLGFVVIIGALTAVQIAMSKFKVNGLNSMGIALSMQMLGLALLEIAGVIAILGHINANAYDQGISGFITSLAAITVAMGLLGKYVNGLNMMGIAASLIALGVAMGIFAIEIAALGAIGIETVMTGIFAIAAALTVLGVAGALITPVISGNLMLFSLALTTLAAGVALAGVGVLAFTVALAAFGKAMSTYGPSIGNSLVLLATSLSTTLTILLTSLVNTLAAIAPSIAKIVMSFIETIISTITALIPMIADAGYQLFMGLLTGIANHISEITITVATIVSEFLNALAQALPMIIDAGMNLIVSFFDGLASGIDNNGKGILASIKNFLGSVINFVITALEDLIDTLPLGKIGDKIGGMLEGAKDAVTETFKYDETVSNSAKDIPAKVANAVTDDANTGVLASAGTNIVNKIKSGLTSDSSNLLITQSGNGFIDTLTKGMTEKQEDVETASENLAQAGADSADEKKDEFETVGTNLALGIADGLGNSDAIDAVCTKARELVSSAIAAANDEGGIESPSKETYKTGRFLVLGAVKGIGDYAHVLKDSASDMIGNTISSIGTAMKSIYDFGGPNSRMPVRPIFDLSDLERSSSKIDNMFDTQNLKRMTETSINVNSRISQLNDLVNVTKKIYKTVEGGQFGNTNNYTFNGSEGSSMEEMYDYLMNKMNRQYKSTNSRWSY